MESLDISIHCTNGIKKYPAKAHARRVAEKLGRHAGVIGIVGTKTAFYSNSDQPQPFRQDRYFYYLSGCNEPNCYILYDIAKDILTLWLPPVDYRRFYYDGRGSTVEEALEKYDVDRAFYLDQRLQGYVEGLFAGADVLQLGSTSEDPLRRAMDACRSVKDVDEIGLIREANKITAEAHKDVLLQLRDCKSEADAEAIYMRTCISRRAREQAYGPIFGAGLNASQLHYIDNDADFGRSQLLLIDAGCEWQRYASDVTRTIPLNRKDPGHWPSPEAKQLYEAVERIQEKCIALMKAGTKFSFVALTAQHLAIDSLLELGILKGDHDDIWEAGTNRAFFPHGLGHHLGLEVHDVTPPRQRTARHDDEFVFDWARRGRGKHARLLSHDAPSDEPAMESGNVITIEPGLYFNDVILQRFFLDDAKHKKYIVRDVLERCMPVGGVRIEDDILITEAGPENLTTAPKGEEMLKILRQQG